MLARAKVNLLLAVRPGAGADGYHAVTSVMCALELADAVEAGARREPGLSLACRPDPVAERGLPPERNLAWRAAQAMAERFERPLALDISIEKRIPSEAGLGGGSSDAAAVMRALAAAWGVEARDPRLVETAASLGADVPFFLEDAPGLFVGRGDVPVERFRPFALPVALVKPPGGVSTARAYRELDRLAPAVPDAAPLLDALRRGDAGRVPFLCANNMEGAAAACEPAVGEALAFLGSREGGLGRPLLCGSGSCAALFCASDEAASAVAAQARACGWWASATRTLGPQGARG